MHLQALDVDKDRKIIEKKAIMAEEEERPN